jgi:amino acid transporter
LLLATKHSVLDVVAWGGTIGTYALLFPYAVVAAAAPVFLRKEGRMRAQDVLMSALSVMALVGVFVGSFLPLPPAPYSWFPFLFILYIALGAVWFKFHKSGT